MMTSQIWSSVNLRIDCAGGMSSSLLLPVLQHQLLGLTDVVLGIAGLVA